MPSPFFLPIIIQEPTIDLLSNNKKVHHWLNLESHINQPPQCVDDCIY
jgi:hypothetical protein